MTANLRASASVVVVSLRPPSQASSCLLHAWGGILSRMGWWHSELTLHVCTFTEDAAGHQEEEAPTGE